VWLAATIAVVLVVRAAGSNTSNDLRLPGTDSQRATDLLAERFPPQQNGSSPVVFHTASGKVTDAKEKKAIEASHTAIKKLPDVASATDPFSQQGAAQISKNKRTAFIPVLLDVGSADLTQEIAETVENAAEPARKAGMEVAVGGPIGSELSEPATESSEVIGLGAAMIILAFTFGTLVAMGLPIVSAVIGLLVGLSLIGLLGHLVTVPTVAPTLATMIGLGVGIDYALFLVSRHRTQRREGMGVHESIAQAVATAGSAIVFAGGTVIIALITLLVAGIPLVTTLGYTSAFAVATALLAAISLLPATLSLVGERIDSLRVPAFLRPRPKEPGRGFWAAWARFVTTHPWLCIAAAAAILIPLIIPLRSLDFGQEDVGATPKSTTERQAYDLMAAGFGVGYNGPLLVAVELGTPAKASSEFENQKKQAQSLQKQLEQEQKQGKSKQKQLEQQSAHLNQQQQQLEQQQKQLEQQQKQLESEQAALEDEANELAREQSQLRAAGDRLKEQQAAVLARLGAVAAQERQLAGAGAELREEARTITDALPRARSLAAQERQIVREGARLAREAARIVAELARTRARARVVEARLQRARLPGERARLEARLARLEREQQQLESGLERIGRQEQALRSQSQALSARAHAGREQLQGQLARVLRQEQALRMQSQALIARSRTLAGEEKQLAKRSTVLASQAASLAKQAKATVERKQELVEDAASLQVQGAQLQTSAANLQTDAANLQTQKVELQEQQQQAKTQQKQAEQLQQQLTDELTKAGGDERGTDPRLVNLQDALGATDGAKVVSPPEINKAGDAAIFSAIATTAPAAPATADLVQTLRTYTIPQATSGTNVQAFVGGQTASYVDLAAGISSRLVLVILAVVALSLLLLLAAYRSLLVAAQAALTNVLSVAAAFGVLTACFQWGWGLGLVGLDTASGTDPIASYVPLMMFAVLFGLSMDYQVFLVSQIEHFRTRAASDRDAVASGLEAAARVIAAAALIMMSVFGSFVLNGDPTVKQFGVGLSVGVFLAATTVLLVAPALMVLAAQGTWWVPQWLDRALPHLDIEGARSQPAAEVRPSVAAPPAHADF
jgi:uncharacterized membrane protein YdfJ with MMPL/SSD domain